MENTRLKSYEYDVNESNYNKLVRVDSNTVAMIYHYLRDNGRSYFNTILPLMGQQQRSLQNYYNSGDFFDTDLIHLRDDMYVALTRVKQLMVT